MLCKSCTVWISSGTRFKLREPPIPLSNFNQITSYPTVSLSHRFDYNIIVNHSTVFIMGGCASKPAVEDQPWVVVRATSRDEFASIFETPVRTHTRARTHARTIQFHLLSFHHFSSVFIYSFHRSSRMTPNWCNVSHS